MNIVLSGMYLVVQALRNEGKRTRLKSNRWTPTNTFRTELKVDKQRNIWSSPKRSTCTILVHACKFVCVFMACARGTHDERKIALSLTCTASLHNELATAELPLSRGSSPCTCRPRSSSTGVLPPPVEGQFIGHPGRSGILPCYAAGHTGYSGWKCSKCCVWCQMNNPTLTIPACFSFRSGPHTTVQLGGGFATFFRILLRKSQFHPTTKIMS